MSVEVSYGRKKVMFPENWDELTTKQYLWVCESFGQLLSKEGKISESDFYASKVILIKKFLRMPLSKFQFVDAEQLACLLPLLEFLDGDVTLNKNLVPSFRCLGIKYYGPKSRLTTSSMGEFASADSYFIKSHKSTDDLYIYKLLATLYRPRQRFVLLKKWLGTWNGDLRQKFNSSTLDRRAKFFKKHLHQKHKWAVLYFYEGFRTNNVTSFRNLFAKPLAEGETNHHKKTGNDYGWVGTVLEMAGDKFGDLKGTEDTNWFTLFVELSRQMDKSQQQPN